MDKQMYLINAMWPDKNDRIIFFLAYPENHKPGRQKKKYKTLQRNLFPWKNLEAIINGSNMRWGKSIVTFLKEIPEILTRSAWLQQCADILVIACGWLFLLLSQSFFSGYACE